MARPRVYRHQVRCPECGSNRMPKDGHSKGRQVYHCGDCGRRYIPEAAYHRPSAANKECAVAMYRESSSLRATGRVFGVSAQAVTLWLKKRCAPRCPGWGGGADSATPVLPAFRRRRCDCLG